MFLKGRELLESDNAKTLSVLKVINQERFITSKKFSSSVKRANLLEKNNMLSEAAKRVLTALFYEYAPDGRMDMEILCKYFNKCVGGGCTLQDSRIKSVFRDHDDDGDGVLTLQNYLNWYTIASRTSEHVVWSNLASHGIGNDLR